VATHRQGRPARLGKRLMTEAPGASLERERRHLLCLRPLPVLISRPESAPFLAGECAFARPAIGQHIVLQSWPGGRMVSLSYATGV
jgi:hypothetical protein